MNNPLATKVFSMIMVVGLVVLAPSCDIVSSPSAEALINDGISESVIPLEFTTYTREGVFSISYPQTWKPAMSIMDEIWEEIKDDMEDLDSDVDMEDSSMVFFGGMPDAEGYYPNVNVIIIPRTFGYRDIDEILESEDLFESEHPTPGYHEFSRMQTTVDGRPAVLIDSEDNEPEYGRWRYLQMVTVKDKLVWWITCAAEAQHFSGFESTFDKVVRSLRLLE